MTNGSMTSEDQSDLNGMVRMGTVSSVDVDQGTARVNFVDRDDMVSGSLKVLKSQPLITAEKAKSGGYFSTSATYASAPRSLGKDESYDKETPDNIDITGTCTYAGETKSEETKIEVHPWMPYIGQMVICLYPPGAADGFILGGL